METLHYPSSVFEDYFSRQVYEPAEDTFLLLDAIESDLEDVKKSKPLIVCEIGVGSGAVIGSLIKALNSESTLYVATDVNECALEATKTAFQVNQIKAQHLVLINDDLINSCQDRLTHSVDVLIFNPPYVVTEDNEIPRVNPSNEEENSNTSSCLSKSDGQSLLPSSWAGGLHGMRVTSRFLTLIPKLLSNQGRFYLVLLKENGIREVIDSLKRLNVDARVTMDRRCGNEHLFVITGRLVIA